MTEAEDVASVLTHTDAFWDFPADVLLPLANRGSRCSFAPGEVLYHQGEALGFTYVLLSGRVRLQRRHRHWIDSVPWGELGPTDTLPECPLDHDPAPATAVAVEESEALVLTDIQLLEALLAVPERAETSVVQLSKRLRTRDDMERALQRAREAGN